MAFFLIFFFVPMLNIYIAAHVIERSSLEATRKKSASMVNELGRVFALRALCTHIIVSELIFVATTRHKNLFFGIAGDRKWTVRYNKKKTKYSPFRFVFAAQICTTIRNCCMLLLAG